MADGIQVRVLYDFDAQPGTGELSVWANEILTVTRNDVGEGWWEGTNSKGECGLFPAGYVEVISNPPPSVPPPPLPPSYIQDNQQNTQQSFQTDANQQSYEPVDDWDDDWDDDESNYGGQDASQNQPPMSGFAVPNRDVDTSNKMVDPSGKGTVRKRLNRFSTFVKSGGELYILGQTKTVVPSDKWIEILDTGSEIIWSPNPTPYTCSVASPKKESKLKGLKSFIIYKLTPSFNNIQVSRRYKHFDWLHERLEDKFTLIPIPPLPDKQISGRYQEEFIEHRMAQLQMWVNRICRHPVLSQSEVWKHFITCTDEKRWKTGKRKSERDELTGASLFHAIKAPESPLDANTVEKQTDNFGKFVIKLDDNVKQLFNITQDQVKKFTGAYRKEFSRIAFTFRDLGAAFDLDESQSSCELTKAIKHTGDTFEEIGKIFEDQPKNDFEPLGDMMHEYKGMLAAWPDILNVQKGALNRKREYQKLLEEGKLEFNEANAVCVRSDVISYATLAEMKHFHYERIADFKEVMQHFLRGQIEFYQKIVQKLQDSLVMYEYVN
ncbi:sorting nexin lst-4-like [Centruroides sculpturatus]|uniref:sorting nexin lst-4-like n=1 Tax=Centruroides sculpturatus TaxID=218467 RepID=UPI000C6E3F89|nr:sorting nexin lst-4-like [Centruroides sculpturatus]